MEVYTKSSLIHWGLDSIDYGVAVVIEFTNVNKEVTWHLLKELKISNSFLVDKEQILFDGWLGSENDFWVNQNSSLNTLRVTSERDFSFIYNDCHIEGTITRDNIDTEFTRINLYGLNLKDSILQVVLVFKSRDKDVNDMCFIFSVSKVVQSHYKFLPINDEDQDKNDY